jgi:hypothetical protein
VYWEGSHYQRMRRWIEELALASQRPAGEDIKLNGGFAS